jgi:hypothetical protein
MLAFSAAGCAWQADMTVATATVVISDESEPDAYGTVCLSGSIEFSVPAHVTDPYDMTTTAAKSNVLYHSI